MIPLNQNDKIKRQDIKDTTRPYKILVSHSSVPHFMINRIVFIVQVYAKIENIFYMTNFFYQKGGWRRVQPTSNDDFAKTYEI
jgi:hypothetical protein